MRSQTYPSCRSLSFQLVLLKPSENPIKPRLKKERVYFNLHFIAVVSQPCMLQENLSFNRPLYSIVVSLQNRCNSWAISSEQKRARGERVARILRFVTNSRDALASYFALACKTQKITPVLQAISGQLRFHDTLSISPLVVVRDSDKKQCYIIFFTIPGPVPFGQWTITA